MRRTRQRRSLPGATSSVTPNARVTEGTLRGTRLEAALGGDLRAFMEDEINLAKRAVTHGVKRNASKLKSALRADVLAAGFSRRLSKTWRQEDYPKHGVSLGAASVVGTNAEGIIRAFEEGAVIRSKDGKFLAIPTSFAPERGIGRKRLTPSNFPEHRYGPLRFVYSASGPSMLVVDNQRRRKGKRGGYALSKNKRDLKTGRGLSTVPMFLLVPQVRLKKRLNVKTITRGVSRSLASDIDDAFAFFGGPR